MESKTVMQYSGRYGNSLLRRILVKQIEQTRGFSIITRDLDAAI